MPRRYQEIYPESPLVDSAGLARPGAASLLTLEYFEAEPSTMPTAVFEQHHVLLNLKPEDHRVEHWRAGEHRDFTYRLHEVIATPAGTSRPAGAGTRARRSSSSRSSPRRSSASRAPRWACS